MDTRYVLIVHLGGLLHSVVPYDNLEKAQDAADEEADERDPNDDEVVVWDLKRDEAVYDAFEEYQED